ncbi:cytochrome P450 [Streptomyces adustus]|uniref:Cytochrome P450 n=1 Tax=Streptomyces adustus TaxID=1609272 RepID=A0A5N8VMU6_9ACTN|nr:cytochrome P450 [Streptomyces adustus]MPY36591.1 cytochrome P450 [Streptomyces adustus]
MTDPSPYVSDRPASGCPVVGNSAAAQLYGPDFATDPRMTYHYLRRFGPVAPVELAPGVEAMLVTDYDAALQVLRSPKTFVKDARRWQALAEGRVPPDSPVLAMMEWKPSSLFADGERHRRLRTAVRESIDRLDQHTLRKYVTRSADKLIDGFGPAGQADLMRDYSALLPLRVCIALAGFPSSYEDIVLAATAGVMNASGPEAARLSEEFLGHLYDLVAHKRRQPGADLTSWLMAHEAGLTDDELVGELYLLIGAGTQPEQAFIGNVLRLLLVDRRFAGDFYNGTMGVEEALDEVLWVDPPMANFSVHFALHDVHLGGVLVPAGVPTLISHAAVTEQLSMLPGQRIGNRAHLAWGAGPHACPVQDEARMIAAIAVERLLDRIPDMALAVHPDGLRWRQGPFARCPESLPVFFPPDFSALAEDSARTAPPGWGSALAPARPNEDSDQGSNGDWRRRFWATISRNGA